MQTDTQDLRGPVTKKAPPPLPAEGLARLPAVLGAVGLSRTSWLLLVKRGHAPQPVRIGPSGGLTAYRVEEIRDWISRQERVVASMDDRRALQYPFSKRQRRQGGRTDDAA